MVQKSLFLTPLNRVLLEKLTVAQVFKKFSIICGTGRFVTGVHSSPPLDPIMGQIIQSTSLFPVSVLLIS
jgi:hypothetical protein